MPKLISIKNIFAKKTENMDKNGQIGIFKEVAQKMKNAEIAFTKLAKKFSTIKKDFKNIEAAMPKATFNFKKKKELENQMRQTFEIILSTTKILEDNSLNELSNPLKEYIYNSLNPTYEKLGAKIKPDLSNLLD